MMNKLLLTPLATMASLLTFAAQTDSVSVRLQNANRDITYKSAYIVDGKTVTLKNETLTATEGNQIAVLVVNGGKLVLDHCTIVKEGDGIRQARQPQQGFGGQPPMDRPKDMPDMKDGQRQQGTPPEGFAQGGPDQRPPQGGPQMGKPDGKPDESGPRQGGPGEGGPGGGMMPGGGGPGGPGGDDDFNFYGLNSAVVAVGEGSQIEMVGCQVTTHAEYANAIFACDNALITITEGIDITTDKNSSRGLFATCAGVVNASGKVVIETSGDHCAALATDRGGGTIIVGTEGTSDQSVLNTAGEGSPCIYSTGDITVYNAIGQAQGSQTMVIEGKNSITIGDCSFSGSSPEHGGIMLYQSTSGDAAEGTSVLNMKDCTIRNNTDTPMLLITNTHSIVYIHHSTLLDAQAHAVTSSYPLITCRNCNSNGRNWGREGSNGGQVEVYAYNQQLTGVLLANESESSITITPDSQSDTTGLIIAQGKGQASIN